MLTHWPEFNYVTTVKSAQLAYRDVHDIACYACIRLKTTQLLRATCYIVLTYSLFFYSQTDSQSDSLIIAVGRSVS